MAITLLNCFMRIPIWIRVQENFCQSNVGPAKNKNILHKSQKKQKKPMNVVLQNKYSTTLLKIVENKMRLSLIVSKVAGWTPSRLFLWDSLKYIIWNKCAIIFLRRTYSWGNPVNGWSCFFSYFLLIYRLKQIIYSLSKQWR